MRVSYLTLSMIVKTYLQKSTFLYGCGKEKHARVGQFAAAPAGPSRPCTSGKHLTVREQKLVVSGGGQARPLQALGLRLGETFGTRSQKGGPPRQVRAILYWLKTRELFETRN